MNTLLRPSLLALVACSALVSSMTAMITMTPPGPQFGKEIPLELHHKTIVFKLPTNETFRHLANSSRGLFAFPADRTNLTVALDIVYEFQGQFSEGARPVQTTTTISPSVLGFGFTPIARMYGLHIENREISERYQAIAEKAAALSAARGVVADMLDGALGEVTGSATPTILGLLPRPAADTAPAHAARAYPLTGWRAVLAPLAPYCPCLRQRLAGEEAQPLTGAAAAAYADGDNRIDHTDPQARIKNKVLLLILLNSLLNDSSLTEWVIGDSAERCTAITVAEELSNPAGEFEGGDYTPLPQAEVVTKTKESLFYFFTHGHEMIARYFAPQPSAAAVTAHSPRAAGAGSGFTLLSPEPGFVGAHAAVTTPRNTARRLALSGPADATPPLATAASPDLIEAVVAAAVTGVADTSGHEGTPAAETGSKEA